MPEGQRGEPELQAVLVMRQRQGSVDGDPAVVDPRQTCLLDRNRLNDGLRTEPDPTAARAWSQRLRFLAQNLLELFALVATLPGATR